MDSSYVRWSFAVGKSNIRIRRSGCEIVAKDSPVGEMVNEMGTDLAYFRQHR